MRADWTASGVCTSGLTALPRGATRRRAASGGAATTSTTSAEPSRRCRWRNRGTGDLTTHGFRASLPASLLWRLGGAVRRQRGGDDRLVRVHVGDGRDADARRLDDVDGVDADARTDVARRRDVVPRHVGRDDGSDDAAILGANAVALPPGRRQDWRDAPGSADRVSGRGVLLRVDRVRNGRLSAGRRAPVHRVEGTSPCLLPGEAPGRGRTLPADAGTAWRHGLRLGLHCSYCCAGLMAILLVIGVMDLRAMAVVTAAITVERLAPAGERVARAIGAAVVGAGLFL